MYQVEELNICTFFILLEGIGKSISFNSILNFAILSDFKMGNVLFGSDLSYLDNNASNYKQSDQ